MKALVRAGGQLQPTKPSYATDVRDFNKYAAGRTITPALVADYFDEVRDRFRASTLRRKKASIKLAIKQTVGRDISVIDELQFNEFFRKLKVAKKSDAIEGGKILSRGELDTLVNRAGEKTAALINCLYETAARISEVLAIKVDDCNVIGEQVKILIRHGKGNRERSVFLPLPVYEKIRALYPGRFLFDNGTGKPIRRESAFKMIRAAGKKIDREIGPHCLRHTWATTTLPTAGLAMVSVYLGHRDKNTTVRFYLHAEPTAEDIRVISKLNRGSRW